MSEIDYTPEGFMNYAESYGRSAFIVAQAMEAGARMPFAVPIGTLALHCVELSLKGVLVKEGMTPDEVRDQFRHNAKKLFVATPLDWSDIDVRDIEFYSDVILSQVLRYRRKDESTIMDNEHLLPFMEKVFHRCLEHVGPANRTLRPEF